MYCFPVEHPDAGLLEDREEIPPAHRAAVVIAHDSHDWNGNSVEELGRQLDFLDATPIGDVSGNDQKIGTIFDANQLPHEIGGHGRANVKVADGSEADGSGHGVELGRVSESR
jgi:hypothetical protein